MNDDMLSQEEINALLQGMDTDGGGESESEELAVDNYLSTIEQDALGEIGNISFGSAATALSTLLNQKVDITTPQVEVVKKSELDDEFPQPHVAIHVEYKDGFQGMNLLVIKQSDAAIIADLMLGGDGTNAVEELGEMHISAVQEAMNQMMGSASTSMSTVFNERVDISPPGVDLLDVQADQGTSNLPEEDVMAKVSFDLKVGNLIDSKIMQLVSISFAKEMVDKLMNPSSGETPQPVDESMKSSEVKQQAAPAAQPAQQEAQRQQAPTQPSVNEQPMAQREPQNFGGNSRTADAQPAAFSSFEPPQLNETETRNLDMLMDIPLEVTVELGRTKKSIREILELSQGSVIELDKLAGEPVDILVNQKLIAKGEVVVIDENFGVRVTDIASPKDRIKNLK
ncbi:flagellar motor switch phosphatase FliY [Texcoconibacillus texcoconensis]|uniref:Flagellar motor switch protein FliN/FliY n=1 Tax=Texcoconibacillus texcoconensis TaxID=1095777 RepID=A0A840QL29_9BACI|nr:flagellar motor switch phosphatase FliY [Texcoconibacillus texcoconensis]MBB5172067.1 flagellar motor switch protein FliN/FliY [Texcoconibacillus texcoconensis]